MLAAKTPNLVIIPFISNLLRPHFAAARPERAPCGTREDKKRNPVLADRIPCDVLIWVY